MSEHKWQAGDQCETRDGRPCRILNWTSGGILYWEVDNGNGGYCVYASHPGEACMTNGYAPKPPTRKVVQWHYVHQSGEVYGTDTPNKGRRVEWELCGDRIVGVRLVEGDE